MLLPSTTIDNGGSSDEGNKPSPAAAVKSMEPAAQNQVMCMEELQLSDKQGNQPVPILFQMDTEIPVSNEKSLIVLAAETSGIVKVKVNKEMNDIHHTKT